ncbi:MAG: hypothetical protein QF844_01015 [Acidimicrobiales bacterium]|nr:hypothetical protein [Acidimicrobiales bacterium]
MSRALPSALPRSLLAEPDLFDDLPPEEHSLPTHGLSEAGRPGLPLRVAPTLAETAQRIRPTTLAVDRTLPVIEALAGLFPDGLRRGVTVGVSGAGARSMALALMARATQTGSWVAVVGTSDMGLAAAFEVGVALERLVVVNAPHPDQWASVVATFVGAVDLVLVSPGHRPSTGDARRLAARCRERGSVLVCLFPEGRSPGEGWPGRIDLQFSMGAATWSGPDASSAGPLARLRSRRVEVSVGGRGVPDDGRSDVLLLPDPTGVPARL